MKKEKKVKVEHRRTDDLTREIVKTVIKSVKNEWIRYNCESTPYNVLCFLGGVCNHKSFLPRPDMRADNTEQSINPSIIAVSRKCWNCIKCCMLSLFMMNISNILCAKNKVYARVFYVTGSSTSIYVVIQTLLLMVVFRF